MQHFLEVGSIFLKGLVWNTLRLLSQLRPPPLEQSDVVKKGDPFISANVLYACSQTRQMRSATALFESMESEGMRIPLGAYNAILDGYASAGDEAGALHVYRKLKVRVECYRRELGLTWHVYISEG